MENKRLYSPARIREVMETHGIRAAKSLGQNFLADGNVVRRIADAANVSSDDCILEVGPGIGTLTEELSMRAKKVVAVEIDRHLLPVLSDTLRGRENVKILHDDILNVDLKSLCREEFGGRKIKVVANLPYYVTTPILTKLVLESESVTMISVLIQKEVAERMSAVEGGKEYGSLSVFMRYYSEPELRFTVPASVFIPKPKVDSAVLRLSVREELEPVGEHFFELVRAAFSMRRKTLLNCLSRSELALSKEDVAAALRELGHPENIRGEALSLGDYIRLSQLL